MGLLDACGLGGAPLSAEAAGAALSHVSSWGVAGEADGQLQFPAQAVEVNDLTLVACAGHAGAAVQAFRPDRSLSHKLGQKADAEIAFAYGLAADGALVAVADFGLHRVQVFRDGGLLCTLACDGLVNPQAVALAGGLAYVAGGQRIFAFELATQKVAASWGGAGGADGRFAHGIRGLAVHESRDEVYATDCENHRVQVFTKAGRHLRTLGGGAGAALGAALSLLCAPPRAVFDRPWGVAVRGELLYVAEHGAGRVQVLTLDGRPLRSLAPKGCGGLAGLAFAGESGELLLATDFGKGRVHVLSTE